MASRFFLRACDYIFVLRPLILIPAWSFYLLGAREGYKAAEPFQAARPLLPSPITFLALTAILVTSYLINQIFDRETDRINKKVFFLSENLLTIKSVLMIAIITFLFASFMFHRVDNIQRIPLIIALLLSLVYSLPPLRFCSRPFLDLFSNAAGFGAIAFVLGYGVFDDSRGRALILSIPYVLLVGGIFLYTALLDIEGDRETGKFSTGVYLGERATERLACILIGLALAASIPLGHFYATTLAGTSFILCLYTLVTGSRKSRAFFVQACTLIVMLGAAAVWPVYFAIIFPLTILARYYYARRFGIIYPGVSQDS